MSENDIPAISEMLRKSVDSVIREFRESPYEHHRMLIRDLLSNQAFPDFLVVLRMAVEDASLDTTDDPDNSSFFRSSALSAGCGAVAIIDQLLDHTDVLVESDE